jgi:hypothetical protein
MGSSRGSADAQGFRLMTEAADKPVEAPDRVRADGVDFLLDRDGILRDVARELGQLRPDHAAEARHHTNGHDDGQKDRRHAAKLRAAQQLDDRRQQEGEQDCERDRDQNFTPKVERGDHDYADLQRRSPRRGRGDQGSQPRRRRRGIRHDHQTLLDMLSQQGGAPVQQK